MIRKAHIFHHNDTDGRVSAFIMYQWLKRYKRQYRKTEFYEIDYSQPIDLDPIFDTDLIIFVDYSFSNKQNFEALKRAINAGKKIIWIDHHKSSIDAVSELGGLPYGDYEHNNLSIFYYDTFSATKLCYAYCLARINTGNEEGMYYLTSKMPAIVDYVNTWDLWNHDKVDKCEEFIYGLESSFYTPKSLFSDIFNSNFSYNIFDMNDSNMVNRMATFIESKIKIGEIIKTDRENTYNHWIDKMSFEVFIKDEINHVNLNGIVMNTSSNSLAFMDLYDKYDFVSPFYLNKDGNWKYSFFSHKKNVRLDKYAKFLGECNELGGISGGGHASASGAILGTCIYHPRCNIVFSKSPLSKKIRIRIE